MPNNQNSCTNKLAELIVQIIEAGLSGNQQRLELAALSTARLLKSDHADSTKRIANLISQSSRGVTRWQEPAPFPANQDIGRSLLKWDEIEPTLPILDKRIRQKADSFLEERREAARLVEGGLLPPRTVLLQGAPGTGKTMLARWIAGQLQIPLVVLDLATAISSLLGKTGHNLRMSLDYARSTPCVLLLDEFDAIAKRRDDTSEIGELNRIVNVLLKELEDWPLTSVLIAATNHPELLDKAINRRFDLVIEIPLPGHSERLSILSGLLASFPNEVPAGVSESIATVTEGQSASDLTRTIQAAVRRHIIGGQPLPQCLLTEVANTIGAAKDRKKLVDLLKVLRQHSHLTVRELAAVTGLSPSKVQYHLKKEAKDA